MLKSMRKWSGKKKLIVGLLGLGLVVPWPVRVGVQCPADKPEMCEGNYWTWRDPVVIKLYYLIAGNEVVLFKGVRYEANSNKLSTLELIEEAFGNGEMTEGQRWLYLAYAIYEYESLPNEFKNQVGWEATAVLADLKDVVSDREIFCGFDPLVRSELKRLVAGAVSCD